MQASLSCFAGEETKIQGNEAKQAEVAQLMSSRSKSHT